MKVIVTGATGFSGPSVANAIVDASPEVRVLERKAGSWSKARIRCQEAVQGNVTDPESLKRAIIALIVTIAIVTLVISRVRQWI